MGNTTYTNFEFNPTGVDSLTNDIGVHGIQWNFMGRRNNLESYDWK